MDARYPVLDEAAIGRVLIEGLASMPVSDRRVLLRCLSVGTGCGHAVSVRGHSDEAKRRATQARRRRSKQACTVAGDDPHMG